MSNQFTLLEIFDEDGNGEVDFKEFIQGVSQFSVKGDKDTKLRYGIKSHVQCDMNKILRIKSLFQRGFETSHPDRLRGVKC